MLVVGELRGYELSGQLEKWEMCLDGVESDQETHDITAKLGQRHGKRKELRPVLEHMETVCYEGKRTNSIT